MFNNKQKSLVHTLSRRHCHNFSRTWRENYISGALLQCSLSVFYLLILLWVIFVKFSFTAPVTASTNNLTQVVIVTVVKVLENSCFLTSLVITNSMEQGLIEKLIVIYVLE